VLRPGMSVVVSVNTKGEGVAVGAAERRRLFAARP